MNKIYFLNDFIRFRKEGNQVLLTNCCTFENYTFPRKVYKILKSFENGFDITLIPKKQFYTDLVEDLLSLDIISKTPSIKTSPLAFSKLERF